MSGAGDPWLAGLTEPTAKWAEYLDIAKATASFSTCKRRQVGAIIIGPLGGLVSSGYNTMNERHGSCGGGDCPRGALSYEDQPADVGYTNPDTPCHALHAEEWAVIHAMTRTTLYDLSKSFMVVTHKPCPNCERFVRGVGLSAVYYDDRG